MRRIVRLSVLFALFPMLISLQWNGNKDPLQNMQIAFLADVHFHDVYAEFPDTEYRGILNPENGRFATIRTMQSQLHSTRLFNENYFAFLAALDDIVRRGVKYVILPGDFSDDGQPVHLKGLKKILDQYETEHGMKFFLTTGNHDPVRPFAQEGGKRDFLGEGGMAQPVMSSSGLFNHNPRTELPPVITRDIRKMGYMEIVDLLGDFGFYPREDYLYWETPFSHYNQSTYSFSKARKAAKLEKRNYPVHPDGTPVHSNGAHMPTGTLAKIPEEVFATGVPAEAPKGIPAKETQAAREAVQVNADGVPVPDVSYLVEPIKGLWLLAIDANVYIPQENAGEAPGDPSNYSGASIGYNHVLSHKQHLIGWIKSVMKRAEELNKTVVVFSHYPMVDFHDDATAEIDALLKGNKMQNHRIPGEEVAELFADAGIKVHFGGHIHINDTGIRTTPSGNTLVNVQTPSLAAYIPAYKLLTIREGIHMEIETIVIDSVPRYNELFELYRMEYAFLEQQGGKGSWNKSILEAGNYREYTAWQLEELVRLRFIPGEWPPEFVHTLMDLSGIQLLELAFSINDPSNQNSLDYYLQEKGMAPEAFNEWNGQDLIYDLYRLRSADRLALEDIGKVRIRQYNLVMKLILDGNRSGNSADTDLLQQLKKFASIYEKFLGGAPANHFIIDTGSGEVIEILK